MKHESLESAGLEVLEARITPSVVISLPHVTDQPEMLDSSTVAYNDGDGDRIVVKFDKPIVTHESFDKIFHFDEVTTAAREPGFELRELDLSGFTGVKDLRGLGVSISAIANSPGDGLANVGFIKADGLDLGAVTVHGNLGKIVAGDAKLSTAGLESLTVESLGALGEAGPLDATALTSIVAGSLKKLNVAHDINGALLRLLGERNADLLEAYVGGDVVGGGFRYSGGILAEGGIKSLTIAGDIVGGSAERSGFIHTGEGIKSLVVGGDIQGGSAYGAGRIEAVGIGSVAIAGELHFGEGAYAGSIYSTKDIKSLTVGAGITGGSYTGSGSVFSDKSIGKIAITGDLDGGTGEVSGYIEAQKRIGSVTVEGDLLGSGGSRSGSIASFYGGIGRIDIGGNDEGYGLGSGIISEFIYKGARSSHSSSGGSHGGTLLTMWVMAGDGWGYIDYGTKDVVEVPLNGENVTITLWELPSGSNEKTLHGSLATFIRGIVTSVDPVQGGSRTVRFVGPEGLLSVSDIAAGHGFQWPSGISFSDAGGGNILVTVAAGTGKFTTSPWKLIY